MFLTLLKILNWTNIFFSLASNFCLTAWNLVYLLKALRQLQSTTLSVTRFSLSTLSLMRLFYQQRTCVCFSFCATSRPAASTHVSSAASVQSSSSSFIFWSSKRLLKFSSFPNWHKKLSILGWPGATLLLLNDLKGFRLIAMIITIWIHIRFSLQVNVLGSNAVCFS